MKIDTYQALLILLIIISFNRWTKDAKFSLLKVGLYIKKLGKIGRSQLF